MMVTTWLALMLARTTTCSWLLLLLIGLTVGKENITQEQDIKVLNKNASAEHMLILADHGPNLDALKEMHERMMKDYGALEPLKEKPDQEHFVYNVTFYADAAHFDEDPVSLEKELKEILANIDIWTNSLTEPHFSMKFQWKLKVFLPGDKERIKYNFRGQVIHSETVFVAMQQTDILQRDPAHILFLLMPYMEGRQTLYSESKSIRGVASASLFREGGIGMAKIWTRKSYPQYFLTETRTGYQWRYYRDLCIAKGTCHYTASNEPPHNGPINTLGMDAMKEAVKRHVEEKPTPELLMELVDRNLSYHQQTFIGVVAHEIGHLLGAPERGEIRSSDEDEKYWDVMVSPMAGTRYGDTSKYAIYLKVACKIYLKDNAYQRRLDIKSRSCNPGLNEGDYYRLAGASEWAHNINGNNSDDNSNNGYGNAVGSDGEEHIQWIPVDRNNGNGGMTESRFINGNGMKIYRRVINSGGSGGMGGGGGGIRRIRYVRVGQKWVRADDIQVPGSSMDSAPDSSTDSAPDSSMDSAPDSRSDSTQDSSMISSMGNMESGKENSSVDTGKVNHDDQAEGSEMDYRYSDSQTDVKTADSNTTPRTKVTKAESKKKTKGKKPGKVMVKGGKARHTTTKKTTTGAPITTAGSGSTKAYLVQLEKGKKLLIETSGNSSLSKAK